MAEQDKSESEKVQHEYLYDYDRGIKQELHFGGNGSVNCFLEKSLGMSLEELAEIQFDYLGSWQYIPNEEGINCVAYRSGVKTIPNQPQPKKICLFYVNFFWKLNPKEEDSWKECIKDMAQSLAKGIAYEYPGHAVISYHADPTQEMLNELTR